MYSRGGTVIDQPHPVSDVYVQLADPRIWAALFLHAVTALVALVLVLRSNRKLAALAAGILCVGVSSYRFLDSPVWINPDDVETFRYLSLKDHERFTWMRLFGEDRAQGVQGWNALLWYFTYRLLDSFAATRIVGMGWHVILVMLPWGLRWLSWSGALLTSTLLMTLPWVLWHSRNPVGTDFLLQGMLLIAGLVATREGRRFAAPLTGLLLGLLQATYAAGHLYLAYPLFFLPWRKAVGVLAWATPMSAWIVWSIENSRLLHPDYVESSAFDPLHLLSKIAIALGSLVTAELSLQHTWAWPGAQRLPPVVIGAFLGTAARALFDPFGRRLLLAFAIGLLPSVLSSADLGNSHRMITMVPPLVLIVGAFHRLPWWGALAVAVGLGIGGIIAWDAFIDALPTTLPPGSRSVRDVNTYPWP